MVRQHGCRSQALSESRNRRGAPRSQAEPERLQMAPAVRGFHQLIPKEQNPMLTNLTAREMAPRRGAETTMPFGPRRCMFINAAERMAEEGEPLEEAALDDCETLDLFYRTLCAVLYNYAPLSGHPGGSISCGRFVARLLFDTMDYDLARPTRRDADIISFAAGHKALGLYAMWALRNEIARIAAPELLPI